MLPHADDRQHQRPLAKRLEGSGSQLNQNCCLINHDPNAVLGVNNLDIDIKRSTVVVVAATGIVDI
jgi:hypothetical protein